MRIYEKNYSSDTKVSEEGGGGDTSGTRADIPLQPMVKTRVRQPMEDYTLEQVDAKGNCDPVGSLC